MSDHFDANFDRDGHADCSNKSHRVILCTEARIRAGFEQPQTVAIG